MLPSCSARTTSAIRSASHSRCASGDNEPKPPARRSRVRESHPVEANWRIVYLPPQLTILRSTRRFTSVPTRKVFTQEILITSTEHRSLQLHEALVFVTACLCEAEFGGEQRPLAVQNLQICGGASGVTRIGKPHSAGSNRVARWLSTRCSSLAHVCINGGITTPLNTRSGIGSLPSRTKSYYRLQPNPAADSSTNSEPRQLQLRQLLIPADKRTTLL
jgi:hypothetical protein